VSPFLAIKISTHLIYLHKQIPLSKAGASILTSLLIDFERYSKPRNSLMPQTLILAWNSSIVEIPFGLSSLKKFEAVIVLLMEAGLERLQLSLYFFHLR